MVSLRWIAPVLLLLLGASACGDDEPAADGGTDAGSDEGRAGRGGTGGGGRGGIGGGRAGAGGAGGKGGAGSVVGQAVTIRFRAAVGDEALNCGQEYASFGKSKVRATPQDFRFFVESVSLIRSDGELEPVVLDDRPPFQTKDVALLDFTDRKGQCAVGGATTNTTITGTVPRGEYTGIEFVNGVPETLNHENITLAKPPLQDASTYWGWASGYRFIMSSIVLLDAPAAPAEDAGTHGGMPGASFVHVGSSGCSGAANTGFMCSRPGRNRVRLEGFDAAENVIVADLGAAFADVDLSEAVECHGPAPECAPAYAAFGIDLESGSALDSQRVYRVE